MLRVDVERSEHVACLPALHEAEDRDGDRQEEHGPPAEDQRVAEEEEDDSGQPEENDADVEERDEVVNPGDELGKDARLSRGWMGSEAFEHPTGPTGALAQQPIESLRDDGKAERNRFVLHDPPRGEHRPGKHDVLTDRIGPSADGPQVARPVARERSLRDERGVVRRLHPFDAVDP